MKALYNYLKILERQRRTIMAKVGIVMGSDSDMPIMAKAAKSDMTLLALL